MPERRLPSLIGGMKDLLASKEVPLQFATWAGLWTISAAIERRVWITNRKGPLFPNTFFILASPPGIGKSLAINPAKELIKSLGPERLSKSSMTSASFADDLRASPRTIIDTKNQLVPKSDYFCLNVASTEFQVALPEYDTGLLGKLTDIWDGGEYGESRRGGEGKNTFHLERVLVTLLAGTTPQHIFSTFPESAWGTGFMARTIIVWADEDDIEPMDLFGSEEYEELDKETERQFALLKAEVKTISQMYGKMILNPGCKELINSFHRESRFGGEPRPTHPRLLNYAVRRTAHLLKLLMLSALDRGATDYIIREEDFVRAFDWLTSVEINMPKLFKFNQSGGDVQITQDLHHFAFQEWLRTKKSVPKSKIVNFLLAKTQAARVAGILETAVAGGWLKVRTEEGRGLCYMPKAQTPGEDDRIREG